LASHGVNVGQGLKAPAAWFLQSQDAADIDRTNFIVKKLDQYHGFASGIFRQLHIAGTCTVVEAMFSYETIFNIIGDITYALWFEKLAYNALPASLTPDM